MTPEKEAVPDVLERGLVVAPRVPVAAVVQALSVNAANEIE